MADQSIGIMQGAFFVPKNQLLSWVNQILDLNINKIQQLGTGAVYCQILDAMYPGKVKIAKVNWSARNQWEFIQNLKILQQGFQKCNIKKHIQIEKLAKSKYQDNLEFMQWFKRFYDLNGGMKQQNYDPNLKRNEIPNFSFVDYRENPKKREKQEQIRRGKSKSQLNKIVTIHKKDLSLSKKHISPQQGIFYFSKLKAIDRQKFLKKVSRRIVKKQKKQHKQ